MSAQRVTMRALALSAVLAANLFLYPCSGLADEGQPIPISYIEPGEQPQTLDSYVCLDETTSRLSSGWYVANGNVTLSNRLEVEGDVNLVLCDGCTLTAGSGLAFLDCARLKLYAQSDASGRLVVLGGVTVEWTLGASQNADSPGELDRIVGATQLDVEVGDQIAGGEQPAGGVETKRIENASKLDESLFSKPSICVRPTLAQADSSQNEGVVDAARQSEVAGNGERGTRSAARTSPSAMLSTVQSPALTTASEGGATVTVSFDANGGSGTMSSMQVTAGETFTLPACTFDPPSGKVFDSWSLGKPGSNVSVPSSTTVRAWWKKGSASGESSSSSSTDDAGQGSGQGGNQGSGQDGGQGSSQQGGQESSGSQGTQSGGSSTQGAQQGTASQGSAADEGGGVNSAQGAQGNAGGADDSSGEGGGRTSASAGNSSTGGPSAGEASPNTGDTTVSNLSAMLIAVLGVATIAEGVSLRFKRRVRPAHAR